MKLYKRAMIEIMLRALGIAGFGALSVIPSVMCAGDGRLRSRVASYMGLAGSGALMLSAPVSIVSLQYGCYVTYFGYQE